MTSGMASKSEIDLVRKERELLNDDNKKLKEQVIAEKLRHQRSDADRGREQN